MNAKTSKLIRKVRLAGHTNMSPRAARRLWLKMPWTERNKARKDMLAMMDDK